MLQTTDRTAHNPSESEDKVLAEVQNILNNLSEADDTLKANLHSFSVRSPY